MRKVNLHLLLYTQVHGAIIMDWSVPRIFPPSHELVGAKSRRVRTTQYSKARNTGSAYAPNAVGQTIHTDEIDAGRTFGIQ